jgi:hypothetical protein
VGYSIPLFNIETDKEGILFNPSVFGELASHNSFSIFLGLITFTFGLEILAMKVTPIDASFFLSLEEGDVEGELDYCLGM